VKGKIKSQTSWRKPRGKLGFRGPRFENHCSKLLTRNVLTEVKLTERVLKILVPCIPILLVECFVAYLFTSRCVLQIPVEFVRYRSIRALCITNSPHSDQQNAKHCLLGVYIISQTISTCFDPQVIIIRDQLKQ
jgi:hypothetical protein